MKKKLRIAQVAPLWFPVPPDLGHGGTELVISHLTEELLKRGHKVTLFASGDSRTKGKLVSIIKHNLFDLKVPWLHDSYNVVNLLEAFSQSKKFDIIHTHIDVYDPIFRGLYSNVPSIATLHNPFWPTPNDPIKNKGWSTYRGRVILYNRFPKLPYISISNSYRRRCPANINFSKTIYHGINTKALKFNEKGGDHFVWIGRIGKAKGVHIAVQLARKMRLKLLIAGTIVSNDGKKIFKKEIKPFLGKRIKLVRNITTDRDKSKFFGRAKAFLYPLQWEEPFGLTMIESQACGTPVIALRKGATPEVVKHKKTGFIVNDMREFKKAINNVHLINRIDCRNWIEENFTIKKMVDDYELIYYSTIKSWQKIKN